MWYNQTINCSEIFQRIITLIQPPKFQEWNKEPKSVVFLAKRKKATYNESEDGVTMCEVLDFREKRGEARGEARVITLLSKLLEEGKSEIIPLITTDVSMREKYFKKYGL